LWNREGVRTTRATTITEDRMQTTMEVSTAPINQTDEETVDAELVPEMHSAIRRAPAGASAAVSPRAARITMELDQWLDLDRKLHELYNLVEIAIMQRDEAREQTEQVESSRQVTASRLKEWKTYARSLERRINEARMENLELSFQIKRTADVAEQALALPSFSGQRRRELRERLVEIGDEAGQ
jgi:hypothetical protein